MMLAGFRPLEWILATNSEVADRRASPTLSDYARAVWRRKGLVLGALLLGLGLGLLVFPRMLPSEPKYDARARLDVRSLSVSSADGQNGSESAGAPLGTGALAPDTTAAETAIPRLGTPPRALALGHQAGRSRPVVGDQQHPPGPGQLDRRQPRPGRGGPAGLPRRLCDAPQQRLQRAGTRDPEQAQQ